MKTKLSFTILITIMLILSACGPSEPIQELSDTQWVLVKMPAFDNLGNVEISLNFGTDGSLGGNGGCNGYGGHVDISLGESGIRFSEIFSTEMYCEGHNASEIEAVYFGALIEATSYSQTFEELLISYPSGTLEFLLAP